MRLRVFSLDLSDPFSEPLYEKVLRDVKEIKSSVTTIIKAHQDKAASVGGKDIGCVICSYSF